MMPRNRKLFTIPGILIVGCLMLGLASCQKDEPQPLFNLRYVVKLGLADSVTIQYYSDYYYAAGVLNTINPNDTTELHNITADDFWIGWHTQYNRTNDYYIKVNYENYNNPGNNPFGVYVYANDTVLIASFEDSVYTPVVELTGTVPDF